MPSYKFHIIISLILVAVVLFAFKSFGSIALPSDMSLESLKYWVLVGLVAIFGGIFPDIDIKTSRIFYIFSTVILIALGVLIWLQQTFLALVLVALMLVVINLSHRGITHSLLIGGLLFIPFFLYDHVLGIVWITAYVSHILSDGEFKIA